MQEVLKSRAWPKTVDDYAAMMDENAVRPVRFTNKGDASAVLYDFFKMTVGLRLKKSPSPSLGKILGKASALPRKLSPQGRGENKFSVPASSAAQSFSAPASSENEDLSC